MSLPLTKKLQRLGLTACLAIFCLAAPLAWGYPNFIGFGYTSCLTCHYNPFGNGPLTDYGRALSATAISSRAFYSNQTTEEVIAKRSGFLYQSWQKNKWIRPSLDYRGLYFRGNVGEANEKSETIHMQADANLVLKFGKRDNFVIVGTIGYQPDPSTNQSAQNDSNLRSREHYIGYRPTHNWGIYGGMMDKVFGIRIPDHPAFSRQFTGLAQNDQAHAVLLHYTQESFDFGAQYFLGNLDQKENVRQKGISTQIEYSLLSDLRIGASILSSSSEFLELLEYALHSRMGIGKGSSLMLEIGNVEQTGTISGSEVVGYYALLQNHIQAKRGLFSLITIEYLRPNTQQKNRSLRWGPGLQYFPLQGFEFRLDIYNERAFRETSVRKDSWDLAGQLHVWF